MDAIELLTGAEVDLIAAGGIYGAEGTAWFGVSGPEQIVADAVALVQSVRNDAPCEV